jgi:hypothetical protein
MRRLLALLPLLLGVLPALAAPPVVSVPAEVKGDVGAFVAVRTAVTDAKVVEFYSPDAGLNLFPADLLADKTATVVTASKAGKYRLVCYSGNADGPSKPVVVTVVIGDVPVKPDPPKPDEPKDPPPAPKAVYYFAVVRADQATKDVADAMRLPAWDDLRKAGHVVKDIPLSELPGGIDRPASVPVLVTLRQNADGKTWTVLPGTKPMPTTDAEIRGLLK